MDIISVQSRVAWGYVGNAVAVPIIQSMGTHAWPIDTINLSHHPGHGPSTVSRPSISQFRGWFSEVMSMCPDETVLLLGYLGTAEQGSIALNAWTNAGQRGRIYVDPAFGDDPTGLYVDADIADFQKTTALYRADVLMANRFEVSFLTGHDIMSVEDAADAARSLLNQKLRVVVVSSVPGEPDVIATVLTTHDEAWMTIAPHCDLAAKGTGDLLSAAFTAAHAGGSTPQRALEIASAIVDDAVTDAADRNLTEIDLPRLIQRVATNPTSGNAVQIR